jgi:hypothetical protein
MGKERQDSQNKLRGFVLFSITIIESIGLPGFVILLLLGILITYGSPDQKSQFIDTFILGKGISQNIQSVIIGIWSIIIIIMQQTFWKKRYAKVKEECDRLAEWKSGYQQKVIDTDLQHTHRRKKP